MALTILTFLLPLTNILSAALVVLLTRSVGLRAASLESGISLVLLGVLVSFSSGKEGLVAGLTGALGAGVLWGGALVSSGLLERYKSVNLVVQTLVLMALLGMLVASWVLPEPRAYWQPVLAGWLQATDLPQIKGLPPDWLGTVAALMHGLIGASLLSTLILAMMLGLWLDRDGTSDVWRQGFLNLRLGWVLSGIGVGAGGLLLVGWTSLGGSALLVLGTAFLAQGLAIVHWTADHRGWPGLWPLALYGPLLLGGPPVGVLLALLALAGLVDNVYGLRRRRLNVV